MTYKTHLSTGMLFSAVVFLLIFDLKITPISAPILIFATWLGASTPDLDTPSGGLWQKLPAGSWLGRLIHPVFLGGHRHLSHSWIGFGLFVWLFWLLLQLINHHSSILIPNSLVLLAYAIGYTSHLFADLFTEAGVPLLFPIDYHFGIPPDPFGKVRIKTGRWFENLVVYPIVNFALLFVILHYFGLF